MRYRFAIIFVFFSCFIHGQQQINMAAIDSLDNDLDKVIKMSSWMENYIYTSPELSAKVAYMIDSISKNTDNPTISGINHNVAGMNLYCQKNYEGSVQEYLKALQIFEDLDSLRMIARINNNIASSYATSGDLEGSIAYYKKALNYYEKTKETLWIAHSNNNIAIQYMNHGKLEEADQFFNVARTYYQQLDLKLYKGIVDLNYGNLKNEQKEFKAAILLYEEAMKLVNKDQNKLLHAASLGGIGTANNGIGNFNGAKKAFLKSIEYSEELGHTDQLKVSLEGLALSEEKLGNYQLALETFKKYNDVKDTLFIQQQNESLVEAIEKYESVEREKEIADLNNKNEISQLKLSTSRKLLWGSLAALLIFLGLAYYLFTLNKTVNCQNNIITKALGEKDLLLREIHHRVKNNLQFISSLLSLQSEHVDDPTAKSALHTGESRVKSMALIHQNLYREENLTGIDASRYFEKLTQNLFDTYNIDERRIKLKLNVEETNLDIDTMVPLGLIVNELISNSLKYAFPNKSMGEVIVTLKENNKKLELTVSDNGIGINPVQMLKIGDSFGYKLVDAFLTQLDAKMDIENDHGTIVHISISDYKKIA